MIRHICVAVFLSIVGLAPVQAQTEVKVAAARLLYLDGRYEAALQVLIPAAEAGNARAQNIVGAAYQYGNGGLPVDAQKALQYFGLSAAQDFPSSHHNLGVLYENGMAGLVPDMQVARAYYEQSVAIGWVGSFEISHICCATGLAALPIFPAPSICWNRAARRVTHNPFMNWPICIMMAWPLR